MTGTNWATANIAWREVRRTLPKSSLISVRRSYGWRLFARFRLANAWHFICGPLAVTARAPWLEKSARALYPNRFASPPSAAAMSDPAPVDPLAGWDGAICPPHELPPGTPPVIRELCKRANEGGAEGDFAGEVLSLLAAYRATLSATGGSDGR